jgi:hypothetical protein
MSTTTQQANETVQRLLSRSATDMEFRRKLLTEPRAAVAEFNGKSIEEVPESFNIRFVEKNETTVVLPDPIVAEAELSEGELETVSGGTTPGCVALGLAVLLLAETIHDHYDDRSDTQ